MSNACFSHNASASRDPKMLKLRMKLGVEGIGIYWMLIERLMEAKDFTDEADYNALAFLIGTEPEKVQSVIEDFGLFVMKEGGFSTPILLHRADNKDAQRIDMRKKRKRAGIISALLRDGKATREELAALSDKELSELNNELRTLDKEADEENKEEDEADKSTQGTCVNTEEHVLTPREHVLTPREHVLTPKEHVLTPEEHVLTPREHVLTPEEHVLTPREHVLTPREHVLTPKGVKEIEKKDEEKERTKEKEVESKDKEKSPPLSRVRAMEGSFSSSCLISDKGSANENANKNASAIGAELQNAVASWNELCPRLPPVSYLSEKRATALRALLGNLGASPPEQITLFRALLRRANASNFLSGENKRGWKASLDWFLNDDNVLRLMEGQFDNPEPRPQTRDKPPERNKHVRSDRNVNDEWT